MQRQSFTESQEKEKLIRRSNEAINEDLADDDEDTSDAEKNSGSDDEEEDEEEEAKEASPKGSPDVRKRRTRKAD